MKILFIYQALSTFVKKDLEILKKTHTVIEIQFEGMCDIARVWKGIQWCDIVFCWFVKMHAFIATCFGEKMGKKIIVVSGGDDVASGRVNGKLYGLYAHPLKRWCPAFVLKHADLILTVSKSNHRETLDNAKIGLSRMRLIYHGFDAAVFAPSKDTVKEKIVITISEISSETIYLKGLMLFAQSAVLLPGVKFVLVGPCKDDSKKLLELVSAPNIEFAGLLSGAELVRLLQKSSVYVQGSMYESFGCALAEAMLCECVPVVARAQAIPEVVGDCGFYLDELTPQELARKIKEAQKRPELGKMARERVMKLFPLERRTKELLCAIDEVMAN